MDSLFSTVLLLATTLSAAPATTASFTPTAPASTFEISSATPEAMPLAYEPSLTTTPMFSKLALMSGGITAPREPKEEKPKKGKKPRERQAAGNESNEGLGPERARILLRSLTVPGWGQATLGRRGSAKIFLLAEAGVWGAFTAFRIQQVLRTDAYLRTARLSAGIDLRDKDDEFRRIVGAFASSDEYNLLVVTRDAANIYLKDPNNPDFDGYHAYIAKHSLSGDMAWHWTDEAAFDRYGGQRKFAHRAGLRANTALGLAIANRLVSALHAARTAGRQRAGEAQGWRFEVEPGLAQPGVYRAALTTRF